MATDNRQREQEKRRYGESGEMRRAVASEDKV